MSKCPNCGEEYDTEEIANACAEQDAENADDALLADVEMAER
jgi:hypothetical protein